MGDAALHTLFGDISRLESFAAIMLGEHPLEPSEDARSIARMAEGLARDRDRRREPAAAEADQRILASFRSAYLLARERPPTARAPKPDRETRATKRVRALHALFFLRHRQRAVLTLRYVLGFTVADVSSIVGTPPKVTDGVQRAGLQAVVRRVGGSPIDARRALRAAGASIGSPSVSATRRRGHEPRAVVRLLLAPPAGAAMPVAARSGILWLPRPVYVPWPPPPRSERTPRKQDPPASRWATRWTRVAAAAAVIVVLMSLALVPRSTPIPRTPLAVVPLAPRIGVVPATHRAGPIAAVYRVRSGDTLWAIADRVLGDPFRWPEVWRKNAGKRMSDGARFTDPDRIQPGWVLALPAARRGG